MMKRIRVICIFMAVAIVLLSGCTKRGTAEGKTRHKNIYTKKKNVRNLMTMLLKNA